MSSREFEGEDHAKVYRQFRPKPPHRLLQRIFEFLKEKYPGELLQAVDLGCGSGQCTFLLGSYFTRVLGVDISAAQISETNLQLEELQLNNVSFCVSSADKVPLPDKSVQLITACVAAHWFDLPKVFEEGRRLLCPGGVMAFFSYKLPVYSLLQDFSKDKAIQELMDKTFNLLLDYCAPGGLGVLKNEYRDVHIPYADFTREENFTQDYVTSLSRIVGTVKSYSPFQNYCKEKGQNAGEILLTQLQTEMTQIAELKDEDFDKLVFSHRVEYYLIMARIPVE